MDELPLRLKAFLTEAAVQLRDARLPKSLTEAMERLSGKVDQPCVVAVVGRMKAGKSTFLNALLVRLWPFLERTQVVPYKALSENGVF
jgi:ABC-type multidrug transport system ATPase subunit